MIPWIIFAVVAVPLVVIAFVVVKRNASEAEHVALDEPGEAERMERDFANAEAYEAEWHEADKERFHEERLP